MSVGRAAIALMIVGWVAIVLWHVVGDVQRLRAARAMPETSLTEICPVYRQWQARWRQAWRERLDRTSGRLTDADLDLLVAGNEVEPLERSCP